MSTHRPSGMVSREPCSESVTEGEKVLPLFPQQEQQSNSLAFPVQFAKQRYAHCCVSERNKVLQSVDCVLVIVLCEIVLRGCVPVGSERVRDSPPLPTYKVRILVQAP